MDNGWGLLMEIPERIKEFIRPAQHLRNRKGYPALGKCFGEGGASDILHHQELCALRGEEVADDGQGWMVQASEDLRLAHELAGKGVPLDEHLLQRHMAL